VSGVYNDVTRDSHQGSHLGEGAFFQTMAEFLVFQFSNCLYWGSDFLRGTNPDFWVIDSVCLERVMRF
jgi:hypothetical protein